MKIALFASNLMLNEIFICFCEYVPAAQISAFVPVRCVCSLVLAMYFLSSKMATEEADYIAGSVEHESTSFLLGEMNRSPLQRVSADALQFTSAMKMILWRPPSLQWGIFWL